MKKISFTLLIWLAMAAMTIAQNDVLLQIHHKLGNDDFQMNASANNNLGHDFNVERLQYYISEISIFHDGGQETPVPGVWILANASDTLPIGLGTFNINQVEKVKFHIGVDSAHNHLDPASYDMGHPLAPQWPSMHWGWISGYRFVAYEGKSGFGLTQTYQFHALGDPYYYPTEVDLQTAPVNSVITLNIDADYTRAFEDINMANGLILHGDYPETRKLLETSGITYLVPRGRLLHWRTSLGSQVCTCILIQVKMVRYFCL